MHYILKGSPGNDNSNCVLWENICMSLWEREVAEELAQERLGRVTTYSGSGPLF